jgi:hypothetical protein
MTIDERCVIELADVRAVELECARCRTRLCVPIAEWKAVPDACQNCRERWAAKPDLGIPSVNNLMTELRYLINNPGLPMVVRLDVVPPVRSA